MNKLILSLLMTIYFTSISAGRPWTFFTYIAGDNNLAFDVNLDINEMKNGANNNVNTLVYANTKLTSDKKVAKKLVITKNKITQVGLEFGLDSGAKSTAMKGLTWAIKYDTSDFIAINFWNHGSGPLNPIKQKRGVCFDDTTGNYLDDKDLKTILAECVKLRGKKIDILCFDACLLGSIEGNVTWSDYVNYIIASEQVIPGYGFNYNLVLNSLVKSPSNPQTFASAIIEAYRKTYGNSNEHTLSAVDSSKIKSLAENVDSVSKLLLKLLNNKDNKKIKNMLSASAQATLSFFEPTYLDLSDLYSNILSRIIKLNNYKDQASLKTLSSLLANGINLIKQAVIKNTSGNPKAHGISIYFPQTYIDESYHKLDWTQRYPNWLAFLKKFVN